MSLKEEINIALEELKAVFGVEPKDVDDVLDILQSLAEQSIRAVGDHEGWEESTDYHIARLLS